MTRHTLQPIPELPLEKVDNETVIPHPINLPLLFARDLLRQLLQLGFTHWRHFVIRFVQDAVQVFVQTIQQETQKFLRVVLLVPIELLCMHTY